MINNVVQENSKKINVLKLKRIICLLLVSLSFQALAQTKWKLEVDAQVTKKGKAMEGAIVSLLKDGNQVEQTRTGNNGKFSFKLDPDGEYKIIASKPGFVSKFIEINTVGVPADESKDGIKIEKQLMSLLPKQIWNEIGMALSFLGREICRPTNPKCQICPLKNDCNYFKNG